MRSENRNIITALMLSILVYLGFNAFFKPSKLDEKAQAHKVEQVESVKTLELERDKALKLSKRASFETSDYQGSIDTNTGLLDDLTLKSYKETTDKDSESVKLLNPMDAKGAFYIEFAPQELDSASKLIPDFKLLSKSKNKVILLGQNDSYAIKRTYTFDQNYRIRVKDEVTNKTITAKKLRGYSGIFRLGEPKTENANILHEGVIGVVGDSLEELTYKSLAKTKRFSKETNNGWLGFTDKYFMTTFLMKDKASVTAEKMENGYNAKVYSSVYIAQPKETISIQYDVFSGPKELKLLERIQTEEGIKKFDLAVDFGWFYFLTKPTLKLLTWLNEMFSSFALALIVITILLKLIAFPMSVKAYRSMKGMKNLQPKIEAIKAKFVGDKVREHQEMMMLYQREGIRPTAGCLPILLQAPIFFVLYKVLYITIEMRHAPFWGWVHDLSAPDSLYVANLFGLLNFSVPYFLQIGLWPLLMGVSMYMQQKSAPVSDPAQERAMLMMPVMFVFLFSGFPAGLVIYWTLSNILTVFQQTVITKYFD
ncbi:MAG: membrane protein insertase YidC [Alphaproteobacteria bacterium]|nr:MAG: membrane protein insertase YidC [Alphaproteobacteria bacterium]